MSTTPQENIQITELADLGLAADHLAALLQESVSSGRNRFLLDKRGKIDDSKLSAIFATLREKSLAGEYVDTRSGRQLLFFPYTTHVDQMTSLRAIDGGPYWTAMAEFLSSVPEHIDRAADFNANFGRMTYWLPSLPDNPTGTDLVERHLLYLGDPNNVRRRDDKYMDTAQLKRVLRATGNPPEQQDLHLPIVVPILNINFPEVPENAVAALGEYDRKIQPHMSKIYSGRAKQQDFFVPEELLFAQRSRTITMVAESLLYDGYDSSAKPVPRPYAIVSAPLYPYDAIGERNGFYHEGWLGWVANEDLIATFRAFKRVEI